MCPNAHDNQRYSDFNGLCADYFGYFGVFVEKPDQPSNWTTFKELVLNFREKSRTHHFSPVSWSSSSRARFLSASGVGFTGACACLAS
jgi:hypothetical protein